MLFASFSDTMNQGCVMALFSFATLIVFARQFAAKHPETAKKAGDFAAKTAADAIKRRV